MRVSAEVKEKTGQRIRAAARKQFTQRGFGETTTRDIAAGAGVAIGTVFNYFPTKESLGIALIEDALVAADSEFRGRPGGTECLEEDLFSFILCELRHLEKLRAFAGEVIEIAFGPAPRLGRCAEAEILRDRHIAILLEIFDSYQIAQPTSATLLHLYWSLYLGIIGFWSRDTSENQYETLALVDQSTRLFAAAVSGVSATLS